MRKHYTGSTGLFGTASEQHLNAVNPSGALIDLDRGAAKSGCYRWESQAEADLHAALELTSDSRTRLGILRAIGVNRETNLKNDDAALEAYGRIADATQNTPSADYYYGVQGAARILTRHGKFDDALAVLRRVDLEMLRGYWRGSMFRALGDTLTAAGRRDERAAAYREVIKEGNSR